MVVAVRPRRRGGGHPRSSSSSELHVANRTIVQKISRGYLAKSTVACRGSRGRGRGDAPSLLVVHHSQRMLRNRDEPLRGLIVRTEHVSILSGAGRDVPNGRSFLLKPPTLTSAHDTYPSDFRFPSDPCPCPQFWTSTVEDS